MTLSRERGLYVDAFPDSRVVLREMMRADVDEMARWPRFAEVDLQWANLNLTTERERDVYYEQGRSNQTRKRFVVLARDNSVIGTISLRSIDYLGGHGTLGIIIHAGAVGRGNGTDAIRNLLAYAFLDLGLRRVLLDVAEKNARARRCYEGVGFSETGFHYGPASTKYVDMVIYKESFMLQESARVRERRWLPE